MPASGQKMRRPLPVCGERGSSLAEFAIALPLLVVLVVGIFDFAAAFNLKQELNNAVREGAQFAARQPSNDLLNSGTPATVDAVRSLVSSYLLAANINDCGLGTGTAAPAGFTWIYVVSGNGCPGSLRLEIHRGVTSAETISGDPNTFNFVCTTVRILYPYQWHFNSVIQLIVPGANYGLTNIQTEATAVNFD